MRENETIQDQGNARQDETIQYNTINHNTRQGNVRQDKSRQYKTIQDCTRQGRAIRYITRQDRI